MRKRKEGCTGGLETCGAGELFDWRTVFVVDGDELEVFVWLARPTHVATLNVTRHKPHLTSEKKVNSQL